MQKNDYLVVKIGVDTAENEPFKNGHVPAFEYFTTYSNAGNSLRRSKVRRMDLDDCLPVWETIVQVHSRVYVGKNPGVIDEVFGTKRARPSGCWCTSKTILSNSFSSNKC